MTGYYPPSGFHFNVSFKDIEDDELDHQFQSVSGLSVTLETEEFAFGGENRYKHVLPVRSKFSNLVLKRGVLVNSKIIDWCKEAIENFEFNPVDLTITLLNENHEPLMTWNVVRAYPVKWEVEEFNSMESKIVAETIELTYQYYTVIHS